MTIGPVVVDTNVVVSGLVTRDPKAPTVRILHGMLRRDFNFLLSVALLAEYRSVILRPKIVQRHGLNEAEVNQLLTEIARSAIVREAPETDDQAPDRRDQHLWALLATREGSVLVTGDQALLENPPPVAGVVSPRTFLELLDGTRTGI